MNGLENLLWSKRKFRKQTIRIPAVIVIETNGVEYLPDRSCWCLSLKMKTHSSKWVFDKLKVYQFNRYGVFVFTSLSIPKASTFRFYVTSFSINEHLFIKTSFCLSVIYHGGVFFLRFLFSLSKYISNFKHEIIGEKNLNQKLFRYFNYHFRAKHNCLFPPRNLTVSIFFFLHKFFLVTFNIPPSLAYCYQSLDTRILLYSFIGEIQWDLLMFYFKHEVTQWR